MLHKCYIENYFNRKKLRSVYHEHNHAADQNTIEVVKSKAKIKHIYGEINIEIFLINIGHNIRLKAYNFFIMIILLYIFCIFIHYFH